MSYYLFKLSFGTPVHFGDSVSAKSLESSTFTICADTLFSALCHEARRTDGTPLIEKLVSCVNNDELKFSDLFPYKNDMLYLPRPIFPPQKSNNLMNTQDRKKIKKLAWIPVNEMNGYLQSVTDGTTLNVNLLTQTFGKYDEAVKVELSRTSAGLEEIKSGEIPKMSMPYFVGSFLFDDNCGLYGIAEYKNKDSLGLLRKLLQRLGYTGLGGKLSSGYGKYTIAAECTSEDNKIENEQANAVFRALDDSKNEYQMLLTSSLPKENEMEQALDGAYFTIKRRGGFVQSAEFAKTAQKKQTQYFLSSGSILKHRFNGNLYEVSLKQGAHPVYRYAYPLFMGVNLYEPA